MGRIIYISDHYDRSHRRNNLSGKRCGTINDELPNIQRCKHTPDTLVEVMMFAIARQMIVEHTSPQQNLIVVLAIAILFAIKKFFFGKFDDIDKTVFLPTQRISSINELVHVEIPKETQHQTLGELLEKQIGTESGNFQVGQCYFFEGGALRVAKVKNGKITQIEVIRSKNAPVVLKR